MHYLIIAVMAFALSMYGCEGKTGPAGPTGASGQAGPAGPAGPQGSTGPAGPAGPQGPAGADGAPGEKGEKGDTGPAGADGADGAPGEQGPAGEQGPPGEQGPAGDPGEAGIPGVDITEIAKADHIAFIIGDAKAAKANLSKILRIGEEREIRAVLRSQSEEILESIDVVLTEKKDADNAVETDVDADDASMAMVTAEKVGSAVIMATAPLVGIAGELSYTITNPITKITLHNGDPAKTKTVADGDLVAHDGEVNLAATQPSGAIQAVARDKNNDPLTPRGGFKWVHDDASVATVALRDHNYKPAKDIKTHTAIITGNGAGETMVTVMVMGESELGDPASKDIDVSVSGSSLTRMMTFTKPTPTQTFTWDIKPEGADDGAWVMGRYSATFTVELYNAISGDQVAFIPADLTITPANGGADLVVSAAADGDQAVTVTVTASSTTDSDTTITDAATAPGNVAKGSRPTVLTLSVDGAKDEKVQFTVRVIQTRE